jgi:ABC-type sugar transport system permease subunit
MRPLALSPQRKPGQIGRQTRAAYLFMLPSLFILLVFVVVPIVQAAWISLHDWQLGSDNNPFTGLSNFQKLAGDERFWNSLRNTVAYTAAVVPGQIILALVFALMVNAKLRGRTVFRAVFFLPVLVSFAVEAIIWRFLLDPNIGLIAYFSSLVGIPSIEWLRSTTWAMPAVIIVSIWRWFGFNLVILLAGLQGISETYHEAARIDGANGWQNFWYVTLPLLRPSLLFAIVNAVISSLQAFDQVYVLTRGGPLFSTETIVAYLYHQGFTLFDMGYASAAAMVLFFLILGLTLVQLKVLRYQEG